MICAFCGFAATQANDIAPVKLAAHPMQFKDVKLRGSWAQAQEADQEVLMSINITQYACHFTTTANLTSCAPSQSWRTYKKDAAGKNGYTYQPGFLAAGDDLKAPQEVSLMECQRTCNDSQKCQAVTFEAKGAEPAGKVKCYWKTAYHFTPQRSNCVADGGAGKPFCQPLPGEMGLGGYYGHYQGHWLSSTAFLVANTGNETVKARANEVLKTFESVMQAWKAKYGYDGYLFPYDPLVFDKLLSGNGAYPYYSVPFYTLHKLMAGLLDQHVHAGSDLAFDLLKRMATWVHTIVERTIQTGGEDLWQKVLLTEWGGMNDVLYNLYSITKDPVHLQTARRFNGWVFTAPLAVGKDDLADLPFPHANFHLPEIIGNARAYELTGNTTDAKITRSFFDVLTANHSYCTGGSNSGECWQKPRDLGAFLGSQTEESCTQYNVLKIARHLFQWEADAAFADFYERAILNGIIGNQNRLDSSMTSYIYMLPLGGVQTKAWGKSDFGFPCCWGTLSESFAKLSDSIYFQSPEDKLRPEGDALYVNQFVSSEVIMENKGVTVQQDAAFPASQNSTTKITVKIAEGQTAKFTLKIRVPKWLKQTGYIKVNGQSTKIDPSSSGGKFYSLARTWADGDVVDVWFPLSLWASPLNDYHPEYNATYAYMYGPMVLAGVNVASDIFVPKSRADEPASFITRNSTESLEFEATAKDGSKMRMLAVHSVMLEKYVVYFMTAGTKPPQPPWHYCPRSQGAENIVQSDEERCAAESDDDEALITAGAPSPAADMATPGYASGHSVAWKIQQGKIVTFV